MWEFFLKLKFYNADSYDYQNFLKIFSVLAVQMPKLEWVKNIFDVSVMQQVWSNNQNYVLLRTFVQQILLKTFYANSPQRLSNFYFVWKKISAEVSNL